MPGLLVEPDEPGRAGRRAAALATDAGLRGAAAAARPWTGGQTLTGWDVTARIVSGVLAAA